MNPAFLLGPAACRSILARTHLEPEREFYVRELTRLTGFAPRTVNVEVDRLAATGLLIERRDGNRRYLRANESHPLFRAVREIVLNTVGLGDVLRESLGTGGIDFAFVFGSMASGAATASSDIDLLIVGDVTLREAVRRLRNAQDHVGREITPVVWTAKEYRRRRAKNDHFLSNVLEQPRIMVFGPDPLGIAEKDPARSVRRISGRQASNNNA